MLYADAFDRVNLLTKIEVWVTNKSIFGHGELWRTLNGTIQDNYRIQA